MALAAVACSSNASNETSDTGGTVLSESGALNVTWQCTSGDGPARGRNRFELLVETTDDGAPVDGLTLSMVPFMPAMGHGSSTVPTITSLGSGKYGVDDVVLAMPGVWELRTTISGEASDYAVPRVEVE
ncbi:MAG TPA: FixH family protein [Polyangiaceae bacterium]